MSKSKSGRGWIVLFLLGILGIGGILVVGSITSPLQAPAPAPSKPAPKITAALSKFTVDRANAQFGFTLVVTNQEPKQKTVRVVVYAKNDMFSPPRRSAWPFAGLLFRQAGTGRGSLSPSAVSRDWSSRPDNTMGMRVVLESNGSEVLKGVLPINKTSQLAAWRGQSLDPRSMYNEAYVWVFSEDGQLIFSKNYDVK